MKLSFNGATTMKADLATDVSAVAPAEFDYLEIQAAKLREFLKTHSVKDLKTLFDENKLKPLSISPIEYVTFRDVPAYARIKAECEELCSIAAAIGCPYVVIIPGNFPPGGLSSYEVIDATDPKRLFIFQISDAENLPLDRLTDAHRLLPGLGTLKLKEMIEAFKRIGYDQVASVEIFRPEYWERDPFELAREAKAAVESVLLKS